MNCTACHTTPPIPNQFGQRFLENGYQLPGTKDGGIVGKKNLGEVTLDDVTNYLGGRLAGDTTRSWSFKKQNPQAPMPELSKIKPFIFPENFVLFAAGMVSKIIEFMVELEHDVEGVVPPWSEAS